MSFISFSVPTDVGYISRPEKTPCKILDVRVEGGADLAVPMPSTPGPMKRSPILELHWPNVAQLHCLNGNCRIQHGRTTHCRALTIGALD